MRQSYGKLRHTGNRGFTLIEVLVALVILGLVMGGLFEMVSSQVNARYQIERRFIAQTASWNRLLEQHRVIKDWTPRGGSRGEAKGEAELYGRDWYWEVSVQETLGENFYRYQVDTSDEADGDSVNSLVAYFVVE